MSLGPWGRDARLSREEEEPVPSSQAQAPQVETHLYLGRAVQTGFIPTCLRFKSSFWKAFPSVASGPPREDRVPRTPKFMSIVGWHSTDQECLTSNFRNRGVTKSSSVQPVTSLLSVRVWCSIKKPVCHAVLDSAGKLALYVLIVFRKDIF